MGVRNLWKILESAQKEESPTNETLGIDASIWIHRYRSINNTSIVVFSIIKRIVSLLFRNNQLIFVFDGKTPPEKLLTVVKRNREQILTELKRHLKKINTNAPCKICSEPDEQILYRHCRHGSVDLNEFESVERLCSESLRNTKNIETWGRLIDDPDFMNESDDSSHHIIEIEEHVVPEGQSLKHRIMFVIYEDPSCDLNKLLPEKFADYSSSRKLSILEQIREVNAFYFPEKFQVDEEIFRTFQIEKTKRAHEIQKMMTSLADGKNQRIMSDYETVFSLTYDLQTAKHQKIEEVCLPVNTKSSQNSTNQKLDDFFNRKSQAQKPRIVKQKSFLDQEFASIENLQDFLSEKSEDKQATFYLEEPEKNESINQNADNVKLQDNLDMKNLNTQEKKKVSDDNVKLQDNLDMKDLSTRDGKKVSDDNVKLLNNSDMKDLSARDGEIIPDEIPSTSLSKASAEITYDEAVKHESDEKSVSELVEQFDIPIKKSQEKQKSDKVTEISFVKTTESLEDTELESLVQEAQLSTKQVQNISNVLKSNSFARSKADFISDLDSIARLLKNILKILNISSIDANYEADGLLGLLSTEFVDEHNSGFIKSTDQKRLKISTSELNKNKPLIDAVVTDDNDVFLFGAKKVYRHFFSPYQAKNKNTEYICKMYTMDSIQKNTSLTRNNMYFLSYLLGSDYTVGITGIGPKKAQEILKISQKMSFDDKNEKSKKELQKYGFDWETLRSGTESVREIYENQSREQRPAFSIRTTEIDTKILKRFMDENHLTKKQIDEIIFYTDKINENLKKSWFKKKIS